MDVITVAQDVLKLIHSQQGDIGDDLAQVERIIKTQIDQIGKQALQSHMDLHQKLGYQGSRRECSCGQKQRFVGHRPRTVKSLLSEVTLHRAYYHCPACGEGCAPYDATAGLGPMALSGGLAKTACELSVDLPFAKAAAKLAATTGLALSASSVERVTRRAGAVADQKEQAQAVLAQEGTPLAKVPAVAPRLYCSTDGVMVPMRGSWDEIKVVECYWRDKDGNIHRRYRARTEKIDGFLPHALAVALTCGLSECRECVLLADGSIWIWDRVAPVIDPHVKVLDWCHAEGHLWAAGRVLHGEGTPACKAWVEPLKEHLWEGHIDVLLEQLQQAKKLLRSPDKRAAIDELVTYIENHRAQMDYGRFRAMGLDIGSGLIESACKTLVQERLKRGGARWKPQHAQSLLSLRACHFNGEWDEFWRQRPLAA